MTVLELGLNGYVMKTTHWEWRLASWLLVLAEECAVTSLDGQDGTGGGQVCLVGDVLGSTEVGTDTDTLENVCSLKE